MSDTVATPADFELGRAALLDMTPADTIGAPAGSIDEGDGVISVYFETTMAGYKGWRWTVSIARIDGGEPSVLETELTPGETALLSPAWVPWADRLAEYKASQAEQASDDELTGTDDDDDEDDFDDEDVNDDDDALLHSGDLDGVDIDSLEDDDDSDDDDEDDDDDEEDDDSDEDDADDEDDEDEDDVDDDEDGDEEDDDEEE